MDNNKIIEFDTPEYWELNGKKVEFIMSIYEYNKWLEQINTNNELSLYNIEQIKRNALELIPYLNNIDELKEKIKDRTQKMKRQILKIYFKSGYDKTKKNELSIAVDKLIDGMSSIWNNEQ